LILVILSVSSLCAQTNNGQVGGIVQDASKALVPGVTITLTNTETGIFQRRLSCGLAGRNQWRIPPDATGIHGYCHIHDFGFNAERSALWFL
ncbi:MAG TPA: carboxypeptidase-like regulatory domain-containing protein, partial [Terriglobia bacterium]|nr:carboxypeptidase-like regulatory domain-containing protein [Terriglobia bacterium]